MEDMKRKTTPTKKPYGPPFKKQIASTAECKGETEDCWEITHAVEAENFVPINELAMYDIEEEYSSDELDSCEDGSDSDESLEPQFCKFKKEDMCKDFKFRIGMEFASLQEFKDAILEHSVLNGRQIKFVKNESVRVRVACKENCHFRALVSRVRKSDTFRMKTLVDKHSCRREFFDNKNAKPGWVAKVIVDKFRNKKKMKLNEIIENVEMQYSVGINTYTAMKARKIAIDMVKGDAMKQYTMLRATQQRSQQKASQESNQKRTTQQRSQHRASQQPAIINSQKQGSKPNTVTAQPSSQASDVQEGQNIPAGQPEIMTKQGKKTQSSKNYQVSRSPKGTRDSKKSKDPEWSKGSKASLGSRATRPITRNMGFRSSKLPLGASGSTNDNPIFL